MQIPLINTVPSGAITNKEGMRQPAFGTWLQQVYDLVFTVQQSGTTANRPTRTLYIGRVYFDTTLVIPIWVSAVSASGVATWINAAGTTV